MSKCGSIQGSERIAALISSSDAFVERVHELPAAEDYALSPACANW
jgi:hypothetical protein